MATFRSDDSDPKEQFTHHNASLGGKGGCSQSTDLLICRDKDANTAWTTAADGTLEERVYYCQNYRGDIASIHEDDGEILERLHYSSYGVPFLCIAGDTDLDGDVDQSDLGAVNASWNGTYSVTCDFNLDGSVNQSDFGIMLANYGTSHGRGMLSTSAVQNFFGYAGYRHDEAIDVLCHVRHRVYHTELGRWTRRDPLGYVDGVNLYEYVQGTPGVRTDPQGLSAMSTMAWSPNKQYWGGCVAKSRNRIHCLKCCLIRDEDGTDTTQLDCRQACIDKFPDPRKDPRRNPKDWGPYSKPGDRYDPDGWWRGNCWRYATCNPAFWPMPGRLRLDPPGVDPKDPSLDCATITKAIIDENPGASLVEDASECPIGTYGIALVLRTGPAIRCDYHFYREECDGNWTDKPGSEKPRGPYADPKEEWERRKDTEPEPYNEWCGIICYPFN